MINFSNLKVRLGGTVILDGATAALPPGGKIGLIGRNGAGKSTLMRALTGQIEADDGAIDMPKEMRIGYLAQEAPSGNETPLETVLAANSERAELLAEAEATTDPQRISDIHERLNAMDAHAEPARAARILSGLGFDEEMQAQPLESFSGGWRMRVALAALLFVAPDMLMLDEPSNHLDLEATLWLENFLRDYRGTMLVISHERDLLNNVVDHILHLKSGRTKLYPGGYDAFEKQSAEQAAQAASVRAKQLAEREKLQAFVDRWRAKAHAAKQAQSRMKALARMAPVEAAVEDPSLIFGFPSPGEMKPPMIVLEDAAVGYAENTPVLSRLSLRIDPEDRIAFLGRNGNGKTTLARLLAGQLDPMAGDIAIHGKTRVGYFTQYQVEELDGDDTPLDHITRAMPEAKPGAVRGQLGRFGFSGDKATIEVRKLSGGERARLALALITRDAPHLLILDEPTNHLDVDAREALVQALADYAGAVVIVSHDRHMLELTADRLILIEDGTATEYDGSIDDYTDLVLGKNEAPPEARSGARKNAKQARREAAEARRQTQELRKAAKAAETLIAKLEKDRSAIDRAMFAPDEAKGDLASATMTELMMKRARLDEKIAEQEERWTEASEALEAAD
ncbi:ABC-F family ATP-binding cassette domain-containing protein [Parasphingopyxis algicola]|uniref:ABC-F family ATP-binding cassette domain-containing protein n=1 Tax=Parasphingopyxis algicola TaxID=2026624 RepID=UPI0015A349EF|nr:ABC-F family ATP-binding cassette domain-containing protein [Parasphingopyxis algicola]QLC23993.1 ABC-F family ATP-binding cassette domain-containing protein [Parasphingopyxis algicola]